MGIMELFYLQEQIEKTMSLNPAMTFADARDQVHRQLDANTPMDLGIADAVVYSDKTDRYTLKTGKSSVRVTNDVAAFLLTHARMTSIGMRPTVRACMVDGVVDAVTLVFISRPEGSRL